MTDRARRREQLRRGSKGRCLQYTEDISTESFPQWFGRAVRADLEREEVLPEDVRALMLPPSSEAKTYRSMYAYGNHIRVRGAESDLNTCDSGVATTFSQDYRASATDRNMRSANLEYIGWVEEIIGVDYRKFELLVLYCTWVKANMRGINATMKHDTYGFMLIRPDRCI
jgi:hypothetical protein